jgi:hypothetical protein
MPSFDAPALALPAESTGLIAPPFDVKAATGTDQFWKSSLTER